MNVIDRLKLAGGAALDVWRGTVNAPIINDTKHYATLWSWYLGTWRDDPYALAQTPTDRPLYENVRQLWRNASAIATFYAQYVYHGELNFTELEDLTNPERCAIPIVPQTGSDSTDELLLTALQQLFITWYWQQQMSLRPWLCSILGATLTVIVDEYATKGIVYPQTIWPGHVPHEDLDVDALGHVKRYAIEYMVNRQASNKFGVKTDAASYRFRQEVDGTAYRYYKDDKPWAYPEIGDAVQPNPYGFVPAIWDRHRQVPWSVHGISAIEPTLQQAMEMNSTLAHALDYQAKKFAAPIGVVGSSAAVRPGRTITIPGGVSVTFPQGASPQPDDVAEARRRAAEDIHLIGMSDSGKFVSIDFDLGQTKEMLQVVMDSILSENPEARYDQELLTMTALTGPGVSRALSRIVGLNELAQQQMDPQTVKLLQMAISMMGFRLNSGVIPRAILTQNPARYEAFRPFDLPSYGQGMETFAIAQREMFPETPLEKAQRLTYVQQLTNPWLQEQAGMPADVVAEQQAELDAQREQEMAMVTGVTGAGGTAIKPNGNGAAKEPVPAR